MWSTATRDQAVSAIQIYFFKHDVAVLSTLLRDSAFIVLAVTVLAVNIQPRQRRCNHSNYKDSTEATKKSFFLVLCEWSSVNGP